MITCPLCKRELQEGTTRCPFCGHAIPEKAGFYISKKSAKTYSSSRLAILTVFVIASALILSGLYFYIRPGPRTNIITRALQKISPASQTTVQGFTQSGSDFDLTVPLPGDPLGIAYKENEFLIGNRVDPWGFLRIQRAGKEFEVEEIPVTEAANQQKMGFHTVTWNGANFVAYTDGSWFQSKKSVFTIHDPKNLTVKAHYPAPDLIGGLTWDGVAYWAATRRNTEDSKEPAYLYRLNRDFQIVDRFEPPAGGCQGLAWDGSYLWFVDVFTDNIYLLNVSESPPTVVHTYNTQFSYLSGITYDGNNIWITEYDEKQLRRLNPALYSKWAGGDFSSNVPAEIAETSQETEQQAEPTSNKTIQRSDTYRSMDSPPYPEDDATVIEFTSEIRGDTLYGSWRIYFGQDLFRNTSSSEQEAISMPTFARYEITVHSDALEAPVVHSYDASAGENIRSMEELASQLAPGSYTISLFIHVQFVDDYGTNRVLNRNIPSLHVELQ